MAAKSILNDNDLKFLNALMRDISAEICDCDCCGDINAGGTLFERMWIGAKRLTDCVSDDNGSIWNFIDSGCIDWESICRRINNNYNEYSAFKNPSRRRMLATFYYYTYRVFVDNAVVSDNMNTDTLVSEIFGLNVDTVISDCIDECCR